MVVVVVAGAVVLVVAAPVVDVVELVVPVVAVDEVVVGTVPVVEVVVAAVVVVVAAPVVVVVATPVVDVVAAPVVEVVVAPVVVVVLAIVAEVVVVGGVVVDVVSAAQPAWRMTCLHAGLSSPRATRKFDTCAAQLTYAPLFDAGQQRLCAAGSRASARTATYLVMEAPPGVVAEAAPRRRREQYRKIHRKGRQGRDSRAGALGSLLFTDRRSGQWQPEQRQIDHHRHRHADGSGPGEVRDPVEQGA